MNDYRIREAMPSDSRALFDAVVDAANWDAATAKPRVSVLADPMIRRYIAGWGRPGDGGMVAVDLEGAAIGACWYRLFPANEPGYGFVAGGVPELTLGVKPVWRAKGVGRALLQAVLDQARAAGYARLSLSVDRANYATRLYRSEAFETVASGDTAVTMVRRLR